MANTVENADLLQGVTPPEGGNPQTSKEVSTKGTSQLDQQAPTSDTTVTDMDVETQQTSNLNITTLLEPHKNPTGGTNIPTDSDIRWQPRGYAEGFLQNFPRDTSRVTMRAQLAPGRAAPTNTKHSANQPNILRGFPSLLERLGTSLGTLRPGQLYPPYPSK